MRYSNIFGPLLLGSSLVLAGCGDESPHLSSNINAGAGNTGLPTGLPGADLPISAPDATGVLNQLTGLLNTVASLLSDLEGLENTGLNGAVSELTDALNTAQQNLGAALNEALAGNQVQSQAATSDVVLDLIGGDLQSAVAQLSAAFTNAFPAAADPFTNITSNLNILDAAFGSSGDISPSLLDNAVTATGPVLSAIGLGIETIELLSMAEALQTGLDDIAGRPDILPGVPHPLATLSPTLTSLQTAVQAGDLNTALGHAQALVPLAGLPGLLTELGLLNNPLSDLLGDVTNGLSSDLDDPADRAVVVHTLADVVSAVNEILLGLIPHSVDPAFDPLVGAVIAITNLLENVGGNPSGTSIAEAFVDNLDGEQTSTAIATTLRDLFSDLFTGVFPVTEITNDMAVALADSTDAITDITEEGLAGVLTPLTEVLAPIVACLDNVEPVGSAVNSLLGLGDATCFAAP